MSEEDTTTNHVNAVRYLIDNLASTRTNISDDDRVVVK